MLEIFLPQTLVSLTINYQSQVYSLIWMNFNNYNSQSKFKK